MSDGSQIEDVDKLVVSRDPGRIVIRVIALMMIAWALWQIGSFVRTGLEGGLTHLNDGLQGPALDLWCVAACFMWLVALFSGIQLFRLRLSGWIGSLIFFAGASTWLAWAIVCWTMTFGTIPYVQSVNLIDAMNSLSFLWAPSYLDHDYLQPVSRTIVGLHFAFLLYLASEWRRFVRRESFKPSRRRAYAKLGVVGLFLVAACVWNLWLENYVQWVRVVRGIEARPPDFSAFDTTNLSDSRRAQASAMIIRRLVKERSKAVAKGILRFDYSLDVADLTPDDIAAVIAATHSPEPAVQECCYAFLGHIGKDEARQCLIDRVNGSVDDVWIVAYQSLAYLRLDQIPDKVVELASKPGPNRALVLMYLDWFRGPRTTNLLLNLVHDPDAEVRYRALQGLVGRSDEVDEKVFLAAQQDPDDLCKQAAFGGIRSIPRLIEFLKQPDVVWRYQQVSNRMHDFAASSLTDLTMEEFGEDANLWQQWWERNGKPLGKRDILRKCLATPLPAPPPPQRWGYDASHPYYKASKRLYDAFDYLRDSDRRALAPDFARYLSSTGSVPGVCERCASDLTSMRFREGVDWYLDPKHAEDIRGYPASVGRSLVSLSGENFLSDMDRWHEWWKENRDKFPSALESDKR